MREGKEKSGGISSKYSVTKVSLARNLDRTESKGFGSIEISIKPWPGYYAVFKSLGEKLHSNGTSGRPYYVFVVDNC